MKRSELEHILRASSAITGATEFVIIGSQSILGRHPDAPGLLLVSMEADLYSPRSAEDAVLIDGSIGEGSPFHKTFGYYAHGVGEETATLPEGWKNRTVAVNGVNTAGATGLCLEPHDLAISKIVAGRPKDLEFVGELVRHGMVTGTLLRSLLRDTALAESVREACVARLNRILG